MLSQALSAIKIVKSISINFGHILLCSLSLN